MMIPKVLVFCVVSGIPSGAGEAATLLFLISAFLFIYSIYI